MEKKYCIADTKLLISSELEIAENGFAPLFAGDFDVPDFTVFIGESDEFDSFTPMYEAESMSIVRKSDTVYTILRTDGKEYLQLVKRDCDNISYVSIKHDCLPWAADMYYLLPAINLHGLLLFRNVLMLHAAFIEYCGRAILFIAPSGVGKTTQAKLWERLFDARVINGDRAAIQLDGDRVLAHSVPIAGTSGECHNESFAVAAIVALSQADDNTLLRLSARRACAALAHNAIFNKWSIGDTELTNDLICETVNRVPVFSLACLPDSSAAELTRKCILSGGGWN